MEWPVIIALVLGLPVILFPAAYVWYLNMGGIYGLIKEARRKRALRREQARAVSRKSI
ncbi:MAG: hypothetical protein IBX68_04945 [Dehalococcoidia bacterium]|nr:hypothetical protein [Dehalococcoidia bacterium]